MEGDDDFGVPAGWYPDPLGLPQLRWWDGQAWTEFTSEAQAPVMMQQQASSFAPEPVVVAAAATSVGSAAAAASEPAAAAFVETTSSADPLVAGGFVAADAGVAVAAAYTESVAPAAERPLSEPAVNVHNLGEQMQFLTRRERREYERRLEAEAALFPHAGAAAGAAQDAPAYIQQPVVPEPAQPEPVLPFLGTAEPVQPFEPIAYANDPSIPIPPMPGSFPSAQPRPESAGAEVPPFVARAFEPEPLQPEPFPEPYRPEPVFAAPFADAEPAPSSFADLIAGGAFPVTPAASSDAILVPAEPAPFVASGLRELEPALSEILADAALAPRPASSHANALPSGFDIDDVVVEAEAAPARRVMSRRTYTVASWILAFSSVIQVALAYLVVDVLAQSTNRPVMAVIWFGGLVIAAGIAGYDRLQLKASGHEHPAAGWWALLTPFVYLIVRWTRTRGETGRGGLLVIVWVIASAAAAGLIYLEPDLFLAAIR